MQPSRIQPSIALAACDCLTPLGDAASTWGALLAGRSALQAVPTLGPDGGDPAPLALLEPMTESTPPRWWPALVGLARSIPQRPWGTAAFPIFITSSNFGIDSTLAFHRSRNPTFAPWTQADHTAFALRQALGWGPNITQLSHACVSAHLGLLQATRQLQAGWAEEALVLSYDFLSPFVVGGFQALKILNAGRPAPYRDQATGSIGLGDGAAWAHLTRAPGPWQISHQCLLNELFHMTANEPQGKGFDALLGPLAADLGRRPLWIKGHGTGTLDIGRLEAQATARHFPGTPLVSWKGGLGHTLGSCGLVELAVARQALQHGRVPGTVGSSVPFFADHVQSAPFASPEGTSALLLSNAFGGAHAALLLSRS